jgi:hypothetical protein
MEYIDFASKISFYEFIQNEFKPPHFNTEGYREEIQLLETNLTIDYLTKTFETNPRMIDIFEELLQLERFTDAQYINFCFDVNILNNAEESVIINYLNNSVFKFENGESNELFTKLYATATTGTPSREQETLFFAKRAIINYIQTIIKKRAAFHYHIQNSIGTRLRIAKYLIENLNAAEYLLSVDLQSFLVSKRHPIDTKGLHGRFGILKIKKILGDSAFQDITTKISEKFLSVAQNTLQVNGFSYVREKAIQGILKRKNKKPKKFDFILLYKGTPKILVETNFYSTSGGGTKIGINEGEYVDLHEDIKTFNKKHNTNLHFTWITDGNYWLSKDGENRFTNLKTNYFTNEFELLNYNLLRECLPKIKEAMRNHD